MNRNLLISSIVTAAVLAGIAVFAWVSLFGAPERQAELVQFTIAVGKDDSSEIAAQLKEGGFIKSERGFRTALSGFIGAFSTCIDCIAPGAYKLSKAMNAWEISRVLKGEPYLKWVTIPEGLRKEEIADLFAQALLWSNEQKERWISTDTAMDFDHTEGVYFPDTYLIPVDEPTADVAARLRAKFEEKFTPYAKEAATQNIKWTTAMKLASIVQREAADKDDMPLIAGILWNRLLADMRLEVDATLQYIKGSKENGWWPKISSADKQINSPYNTYKNTGLPPHPIANPGLDAIDAVLFPEETDCFFYLHDNTGETHCSDTYEGHLQNIERYLR